MSGVVVKGQKGSSSSKDSDGGERGEEKGGSSKGEMGSKAHKGNNSSSSSSGYVGRGGCGKAQSKPDSSSNRESGSSSSSSAAQAGIRLADGRVSSSSGSRGGSSRSRGWDDKQAASAGASVRSAPCSCRQPDLGGVVISDSLSDKSDSDKNEAEVTKQVDIEKDTPGGISPAIMWEIAAQNTAAAVAYAKTITADREAAEARGEEPGEPLPFQFTWPGKPCDDVYAHGFFTNLPVGGQKPTPAPTNYASLSFGGPPTALHVRLVLELLLLCWPDPQVAFVTSSDDNLSPVDHVAQHRWEWLLMMISLLQQMSTEQKQQFLQERGPLLMQLLYQVMQENTGLGGAGISELMTASGDEKWFGWYVAVTHDVGKFHLLADWRVQWGNSVPMVVAMVLQNLLFESLPESLVNPETARIGKVLKGPLGKCAT
jgi:hypothetical protein